ncbi:MAG: InlB B-repeat-containing protein [Eubacterium sp.]|nr:InlB B-repeat-containing protein [Eubacterium sp.]
MYKDECEEACQENVFEIDITGGGISYGDPTRSGYTFAGWYPKNQWVWIDGAWVK